MAFHLFSCRPRLSCPLLAAYQATVTGQQHYSDISPAIYQVACACAPKIVPPLQGELDHLRTADLSIEVIRHFFPGIAGAIGTGGKEPVQDAFQFFLVCGTEAVRTVDLQPLGMIRNPHYLHSVVPRPISKVEITGNNGTGVDLFPYIGSVTRDRLH
jgi:hypothetical protein